MEISVTKDEHAIQNAVLDCFYDIVEEGTSLSAVDGYIDVERDIWLRVGCIGFVKMKRYNARLFEAHPFIYKIHRKQSEAGLKMAVSWFDENGPDEYTSIITNVPRCKRHVALLVRKLGFNQVGCYSDAFWESGAYHDMLLFQRMRKY